MMPESAIAEPRAPKARRSAKVSPSARSMKLLRKAGYCVEKVEQRLPIPGKYVTRDLFNLFDLIAIHPDERIMGVQVTTMANKGKHLTKLYANPILNIWKAKGQAQLHAWRQLGKSREWTCEVTEL